MSISVKEFGVLGDGKTNETKLIQKAIDETAEMGEILYFPKGVYRTGTLVLQDNSHLDLSALAVLKSTDSLDDYRDDIIGCIEAPSFNDAMIFAHKKKNVAITGLGKVDGNGAIFRDGTGEGRPIRPMLLRFVECENLLLRDVTFVDAASWCCHIMYTNNITINNVKIDSHINRNNDGFDLDNCTNVRISDCDLWTGDDAICLKSTTDDICENISVTNCHLISETAAVKFGTSSRGGFKNITITNCTVSDSEYGVIKLLVVDGGILENINISDIVMERVASPFFIRVGARNLKFEKPAEMNHFDDSHEKSDKKGYAKRINISNIYARVTTKELEKAPIMLAGDTESPIQDVNLSNIRVIFPGGGTEEHRDRVVDEGRFFYPEQRYFGVLPAWGFYARHVDGLKITNMRLSLDGEDAREERYFDDVHNMIVLD